MFGKLLIKSFATTMLFSSVALAADLPPPPPPPVPYVPAFTWTGFYLGANVGFGGDRVVYPFSAVAVVGGAAIAGSASITSSGVIGGGQLGYNWGFPNNFLVGFETDFDGAAIRGKVSANAAGQIGGAPFGFAAQIGSRINYIGTVRGRVGYAWDRFLVYGTGGFAYGEVNSAVSAAVDVGGASVAISATQNRSRTGWTAGGGFEYAITKNLTVKTEYLYVDLGTNNILNQTLFGVVGVNINQKTTANIVRAGLNYKFDWFAPAPVVSKY